MPDFGSPVAQNVDVGANRGVQTLSDLMGLQQRQIQIEQQKQTLQTGAALQQRAQAEAQGAQQAMATRQTVQKWSQTGQDDQGNSLYLPGTQEIDPGKFATSVMRLDPTNGPAIAQAAIQTNSDRVMLHSSMLGLTMKQREAVMGPMQAAALNPDRAHMDAANASIDDLVQQNPDMTPVGASAKRLLQLAAKNPDPKARAAMANTFSATYQPGQAVQTQPSGMAQDVGPGIQVGTQAPPAAGGGFTPSTMTTKDIPPGVVTTPAGPLAVARAGPRGPTLTPLTTGGAPAAAPQNLNTTRAIQENVQGMAADDKGRYAQISQEGTNAKTGAVLADQVADLSEQVRTGQLTKEWADRLATLRQHDPDITARQMLTKYAAQLKTMATSGATTDQSRSQIDEGMPSPETMDPDAVKQAAQYVGGIFRMRQARQTHADQFVQTNGNSVGIRGVDDSFMRSADPTVFAYEALPAGKARQDFLRQHGLTTAERQAAFQAQRNQIKHYGGQ